MVLKIVEDPLSLACGPGYPTGPVGPTGPGMPFSPEIVLQIQVTPFDLLVLFLRLSRSSSRSGDINEQQFDLLDT